METDTTASTTVMHTYPPQPQVLTTMQMPLQRQVISVRQSTYATEKSVGLGVAEIILRIICLILCLAMLIAAALAVAAINDIDDIASQEGVTFQQASTYRGAAVWLLFVGSAAVVYHGIVILIRGLYFNLNIKNYFAGFSFANAILCLLFGIALLAGAITNSMYGSDNLDRYDASVCIEIEGGYSDYGVELEEVCDDLETLFITESAAAGTAFFSLILIIPLLILTIMNGIRKMREAPYHQSSYLSAPPPPYANLQNSEF